MHALDQSQRHAAETRLEIGEILRRHGGAFRKSHVLSEQQRKVMFALERCRTAALGGHLYHCERCAHQVPLYNSCRDRHCPSCQSLSQGKWIAQRLERILEIRYFHVVFTLPGELRALARAHPRELYALLFKAASRTLLELGEDPKRLGAQLGLTAVLHTWTRKLHYHPHLHCVVTSGGLSADGQRWVACHGAGRYLFPVKVMSRLFRGKFLAGLRDLFHRGALPLSAELDVPALAHQLSQKEWVVYAKRPFGGAHGLFKYLGRYTHRVGISNQRLIAMNDRGVTFATKNGASLTLPPEEFIRRLLSHVLPARFTKIRHFGLFASANVKTRLEQARKLLAERRPSEQDTLSKSTGDLLGELGELGIDKPRRCPVCQLGVLIRGRALSKARVEVPAPET